MQFIQIEMQTWGEDAKKKIKFADEYSKSVFSCKYIKQKKLNLGIQKYIIKSGQRDIFTKYCPKTS